MKTLNLGLLTVLLFVAAMAYLSIAGASTSDAWTRVQVLSPAEAALVGGTGPGQCNGFCTSNEEYPQCGKDPDLGCESFPYQACPAWSITDGNVINYCGGWPNGSYECFTVAADVLCWSGRICEPIDQVCKSTGSGSTYKDDDECWY